MTIINSKINVGDVFIGKINKCKVQVIKVNNDMVIYKDLATNNQFTQGLANFQRLLMDKENIL